MKPGSQLGPYEIRERLGAGGMGEVYLARDTRLDRDVAVKVLPPEFAADRERLARFELEARAAAALNSPHIAAIFDVGEQDGVHFMVQELLAGKSLRDTLDESRPQLKRALALAGELATGLATAHTAGILHRDLKPDNLFVSPDGHLKILDFGLAKLTEGAAAPGLNADASKSPTMLGTVVGQVMGTAGYMAPEQIEGSQEIDHRADLFAFGCVLYEMVTRRQPFAGKSVLETLHRIGHEEPAAMEEVAVEAPPELRRIVRKCLAKEPADRYQGAADIVVDLRMLAADVASGVAQRPVAAPDVPERSGVPVWVAAALATIAVAAVAWSLWDQRSEPRSAIPTGPVQRFALPQTTFAGYRDAFGLDLTLSPDASTLAIVNPSGAESQLFLRSLDGETDVTLAGTRDAEAPFFSPDGEWLGYVDRAGIHRMRVASIAPPIPLHLTAEPVDGAAWTDRDEIVFCEGSAVWRKAVSGGAAERIIELDDGEQCRRPIALPGVEAVVVEVRADRPALAVVDLAARRRVDLGIAGFAPVWVPGGYILYADWVTNWTNMVRLDLENLTISGEPVRLPSPFGVGTTTRGDEILQASVSAGGTLAYIPPVTASSALVWVDRQGLTTPLQDPDAEPGDLGEARLSPDGRRIAYTSGNDSIRMLEHASATTTLIDDRNRPFYPTWIEDGRRIAYGADPEGHLQILAREVDSAAAPTLLLSLDEPLRAVEWVASHGEMLVRRYAAGRTGMDILAVRLGADAPEPRVILAGPHDEVTATVNPAGELIAYVTNESGRDEVYLTTYPVPGRRIQVSNDGGTEPHWAPSGDELFYFERDTLIAAAVVDGPDFAVAGRERLFSGDFVRYRWHQQYDVHPDGDRFLMIEAQGEPVNVRFVINWVRELQRIALQDP